MSKGVKVDLAQPFLKVDYMSLLCNYKNIFGKPNEGIHSHRFLGLAIVDVVMTIIAAIIISFFLNYSFPKTLSYLLLLGVFLHYIFCVDTAFNKFLMGYVN
jgi:hypothetical protein